MRDLPPQSDLLSDYVGRILRARVYEVAIESPLDTAPRLSKRLKNRVLFKREDLQPVFSFKLRGAHNRIVQLPAEACERGVICSSAGNHAQGVALAARHRGIRAVIVMPRSTPAIKVDAVAALGGEIVLEGDTYDDAAEYALARASAESLTFVHPFADPDVIAGQGTIAVELSRQWREVPDAIFVPVGGGGLICGVGAYIRKLFPTVKVIGVEPVESPSMYESLRAGRPVTLDHVGIFADGVAVRRVADETFRIAHEVVDEIVLVDTDEICAAIKDIFEDSRVLTEPAGALAVAGLKKYLAVHPTVDRSYITLNSGANMNFDRLRHVSERAEIGEQREALIAVEIPERPGAFLRFCNALGTRSVTEFNYRYVKADRARVFVGVTLTGGRDEARQLVASLTQDGYKVRDLSDNELAKLHVRHMIGGQLPPLADELLFRFEFPERPGCLAAFLGAMGERWNISLFHYRNHGSDYARVFVGLQVPTDEREGFLHHIDSLAESQPYTVWNETDNPAYALFLGANGG